jgi:O-antigen/teichoic acid export membrane protein
VFLIDAVGVTQGSLFIRDFRFRVLELRNVASSVIGAATAIVLAALGYGPWAIIVQGVVTGSVSTVLLWSASNWRPRFVFSRASLRSLRGYSGLVFGENLLFYAERNADNFIIARFAGAHLLGIYTVAYNAMLVPLVRLASPIQQVFFPALSRIREPKAVGRVWLRVTRLVSAILIPAFVGMAVVAPEFVHVVLGGKKWDGSIRILEILAWVGILHSVAWQTESVLLALDRASVVFRYAVLSATMSVASFAIGLHWGVVGVAAAYALAATALAPYYVWLGCREVEMRLRDFARGLIGVALSAAGMGAVLLLLRAVIAEPFGEPVELVLLIVTGIAVYGCLSYWLVPELLRELRSLRSGRAKGPGAAAVGTGPV